MARSPEAQALDKIAKALVELSKEFRALNSNFKALNWQTNLTAGNVRNIANAVSSKLSTEHNEEENTND